MNWLLFWLFLHILAAVLAFGPIFVFPIIGSQAQKHPEHGHFALVLNEKIEHGLVIPLALTMLVSGTGLLITANVALFHTAYLLVAIALYLVAMVIALAIMVPTVGKLAKMTENGPPSEPAAFGALVKRTQIFGGLLQLLFLVIIFLMIIKPGGITTGSLFS